MSHNTPIAALALTLLVAAPGVAQEADPQAEAKPLDAIVVQVTGLKSDAGQIGCAVFSKEDGFPNETGKASKQIFVKPKGKKATCTFEALKPGTFAISVVHDIDKNGELNTSFVGKPKEPWGVSNNAPAQRFGPPLYKDCKFKYEGAKKTLTVKLQD
jgi:uncharacterized protein (DUF2141 family)